MIEIKKDKNAVAYVNLNRPEIHNAFNDELIADLTSLFIDLEKDDSIRVVVLSGNGKSFCAGADLNWMKSMVNYSEQENINDSKKLYSLFETLNNFQKPLIGKINGHALGGGLGLVAVCDYVLTHDKAKFGFTETRLGLIPAVISSFCINKIGESHARAWFMSGEMFKGKAAMQMGLVHEVTTLEEFEVRSSEVVNSFLKAAPEASIQAKALIKNLNGKYGEALKDYSCGVIAKRRVSDEGQEGMSALLEKRKAKWIQQDD